MDVLDPNQSSGNWLKVESKTGKTFLFPFNTQVYFILYTEAWKRAQSQNSLFIMNCGSVLLLDVVFSWFLWTMTHGLCSFNTLSTQKSSAVPNFMPALSLLLRHCLAAKVWVQQMEVSALTLRPTCHQSNSLKALNYSICSCSLHQACALYTNRDYFF